MNNTSKPIRHIIRIKFNVPYEQFSNQFIEERLTKEWMGYRLELFMKYTYPSLCRQSCKDFMVLIHYDLKSKLILDELLGNYPPLEKHVRFTADMKSSVAEAIKGYKKVIFTVWDSDNILHPDLIKKIQEVDFEKYKSVVVPRGYIYEIEKKATGEYYYPYPDTFYSIVYEVEAYLNHYRYPYPMNVYEDFYSGYDCQKLRDYKLMEYSFVILVHGKNISNALKRMEATGVVKNISYDESVGEKRLEPFGMNLKKLDRSHQALLCID